MWRIVYYRLSVICASTRTDAHGMSLDRMTDRSTLTAIAPIMAVVFVGYLIIGIPLPVLPMHVHFGLGLSTAP